MEERTDKERFQGINLGRTFLKKGFSPDPFPKTSSMLWLAGFLDEETGKPEPHRVS
jgi:hypothetical protein